MFISRFTKTIVVSRSYNYLQQQSQKQLQQSLQQQRCCMSSVINLSNADDVDKFIKINSKVILYYTATWCGPCRAIKPVYDNLAKEYGTTNPEDKDNDDDVIAFGKIDIDDNPQAAQKEQINSVPTFIGYMNEKVITKFSGADTTKLSSLAEQLKNL